MDSCWVKPLWQGFAKNIHLSRFGLIDTGKHLDDCRFAGAIFSDETVNFTGLDGQARSDQAREHREILW